MCSNAALPASADKTLAQLTTKKRLNSASQTEKSRCHSSVFALATRLLANTDPTKPPNIAMLEGCHYHPIASSIAYDFTKIALFGVVDGYFFPFFRAFQQILIFFEDVTYG